VTGELAPTVQWLWQVNIHAGRPPPGSYDSVTEG